MATDSLRRNMLSDEKMTFSDRTSDRATTNQVAFKHLGEKCYHRSVWGDYLRCYYPTAKMIIAEEERKLHCYKYLPDKEELLKSS